MEIMDMTIAGHLQKAGLFCLLFLRINWKNDLVIILNIVRFGALPVKWMVAGMSLTRKINIASKISPMLVWSPMLVYAITRLILQYVSALILKYVKSHFVTTTVKIRKISVLIPR